jgi:diacylglycerol kinase (ATP)
VELKKVKFIHNPKSGLIRSPRLVRKLIERAIVNASFDYDFTETCHKGHALQLAKEAAEQGYDAVVAVGGDGTANEVATGLLHTNVAMSIVPIGSGNGLARGLNIPVSIRRSAQLLMKGQIRSIDAGKIENRYFFVVTGVGFDALVGKLFDDSSLRGPLPYFTIGLREFIFYRPEVFILRFDGKQVVAPALLVTIANTRQWGNGVIIAPSAEPDDGMLDICIIHRVKFLYALYHFPKLFTGKIDKIRKYERYRTNELEIIREKPGPFHVDGEPNDALTTLRVSIDHKALRIIVPKPKKERTWLRDILKKAEGIGQ